LASFRTACLNASGSSSQPSSRAVSTNLSCWLIDLVRALVSGELLYSIACFRLLLMLCRLYVDEVGNGDLKAAATDPNLRYLSLTGILTNTMLHDSAIQPEIDQLKIDLFGHKDDLPVILHRREIVRREGPFSVLRDPGVDKMFRFRLLHAVRSMPYLAITVTIDKKEHLDRYQVWRFDPYHYCLQCLVERYVLWLNRHDVTGDVVIETRFRKVDKKLKASFQRIYNDGTEYVRKDVAQRRLTSHEIKLKSKKTNCAGLQLCDMIAHPSFRAMRREREKLPRLNDLGYEIVDILEDRKYARNPTTKQIDGWGRKWLP
jgi:hypothetical protein